MKQQSFDDIIKRKTELYEAPVPADAWENIAQGKKKKRRFVFFWWMPGLFLLCGISTISLYIQKDNTDKTIAKQETLRKSESKNRLDSMARRKNYQDSLTGNSTIAVTAKNTTYTLAGNNGITALLQQHTKKNIPERAPAETLRYNDTKQLTEFTGNPQASGMPLPSLARTVDTENEPSDTFPADSAAAIHNDSVLMLIIEDTPAIAKDDSIKKKLKKRSSWALDISLTPFIPLQQQASLLNLKRTELTSGMKKEYSADKIHTQVAPGLAFSIAVRKKITRKLEIGAGLQYARISEKINLSGAEKQTTYSVIQQLASNGLSLEDRTIENVRTGVRTIDARNSYSILSVPLFTQYTLIQRRSFIVTLNTGTYVNIIGKYSNSINGNFEAAYQKQSNRKSGIGIDIFAGLRLSTTSRKKYHFFAEPALRYGLLTYNTSAMLNAKQLHQAGLSLGVSVNIN